MPREKKEILDTVTKKRYPSMFAAGKDLAHLVNGDPNNRLVWFSIHRAFPDRFRVLDKEQNKWVKLPAPGTRAKAAAETVPTAEPSKTKFSVTSAPAPEPAKKVKTAAAAVPAVPAVPARRQRPAPAPVVEDEIAYEEEEEEILEVAELEEEPIYEEEEEEPVPAPAPRRRLATTARN